MTRPGTSSAWPVAPVACARGWLLAAVLGIALLVTMATGGAPAAAHTGAPATASVKPARDAGRVVYCTRRHRPRGCVPVPKAAERPRTRSQQGPDSLTPTNVVNGGGLGGGPGDHRAAALEWAMSQRRQARWAWRCQRFVEEAYGTRGKFDTAAQAAAKLKLNRGPVTGAPRGSLVYFGRDQANRGYGHVGLSLGGGKVVSALAKVTVTDVPRSRYWQELYVGWADAPAAWPGRIPLPPGPSIEDPGLTVRVTAPAFGSTLSGTVPVAATATGAAGVSFFAYYATDPSDPATRAWRPLGAGRRSDDAWIVDWDTTTVPNQGNPLWGTVNIAAVAMGDDGRSTATRDYRRFTVDNRTGPHREVVEPPVVVPPVVVPAVVEPPPVAGAAPHGALLSVVRINGSTAQVTGWARDADALSAPVFVTALVDGQLAASALADAPHASLGAHGFTFPVPTDQFRRTVCIRGASIGPGPDAQIGECGVIHLFADLNRDGIVNCTDLNMLRARFGEEGGQEDLNHDGSVNIADLSILLSNFGKSTPDAQPAPSTGSGPSCQ